MIIRTRTQEYRFRNPHQGGVALIYRKSDNFHIESTKCFGGNVIRATLVHGDKKNVIVVMYIPPSERDGRTLHYFDEAMNKVNVDEVIVRGDMNVNLVNPRDARDNKIVENLYSYNLHDVS